MHRKRYNNFYFVPKPVLLIFFSLCFAFIPLKAQTLKELKLTGIELTNHGKHREAIETLSKYLKQKPLDKEVLTSLAISQYYINNSGESLRLLDLLIENNKTINPDWYLYKALNKHRQHDFINAIRLYKLTVSVLPKTDTRKTFIKDQILRCTNGLLFERVKANVSVDNLGEEVNTIYDEFAPFLSPTYDTKLYFASARPNSSGGKRNEAGVSDDLYGNYCSDMYSALLQNGNWTKVEPLSYMLNGPRNERIIGFTTKGTVMFFLRGFTEFSGDILVDTFKRNIDQIINPQYFESPIRSELGDKDPYFINDSVLIFSSSRAGGLGGMDLYITVHSWKGWTIPVNLGKGINTTYDEVSPFLARDGKTLYYSSNNLQSIGGFDVFKVTYDVSKYVWSKPENQGFPINSADDELDFKLNKDGHYAYFSSRRSVSVGERDIYSAYFSQELKCQEGTHVMPPAFLPEFVNYASIETNPAENSKSEDKEKIKKEEKYSYTINMGPIYYTDEYNILTGSSLVQLDKLAEILIQHPMMQVIVSCHVPDGDNVNIEAYLSLKRSMQLTDYLISKGVNQNQLLARGCGYNYPMVRRDINAKDVSLQQKFNKRLDFHILKQAESGVLVNYQNAKIATPLKDKKGLLFEDVQNGLCYRVQFAATKQPYNGNLLADYTDLVIESRPGSELNYYMVGLSRSYAQISEIYASLLLKGKSDAFIVPYIDGWPITKSQAKNNLEKYPDLLLYVSQER